MSPNSSSSSEHEHLPPVEAWMEENISIHLRLGRDSRPKHSTLTKCCIHFAECIIEGEHLASYFSSYAFFLQLRSGGLARGRPCFPGDQSFYRPLLQAKWIYLGKPQPRIEKPSVQPQAFQVVSFICGSNTVLHTIKYQNNALRHRTSASKSCFDFNMEQK